MAKIQNTVRRYLETVGHYSIGAEIAELCRLRKRRRL